MLGPLTTSTFDSSWGSAMSSDAEKTWVENARVLEVLHDYPNGLTVREIASKLGCSFNAAQNALRELHIEGMADTTVPRRIDESKRWKPAVEA